MSKTDIRSYGSAANTSIESKSLLNVDDVVAADARSDSLQNFLPATNFNSQLSANEQQDNDDDDGDDESFDNHEIIANSACGCSYIIEPLVFLQALASSIIGIAYGQFVYNRILDRLIDESGTNATNFSTPFSHRYPTTSMMLTTTTGSSYPNTTTYETTTTIMPAYVCNATHEPANVHLVRSTASFNYFFGILFQLIMMPVNNYISPVFTHPLLGLMQSHYGGLSPTDYHEVRVRAQEETANLFFVCGLFGGLPVILVTNLLSVNCSNLGRKPLILITQVGFVLRFTLILLQCLNPQWPDWVFYIGAGIEGFTGSTSVFFLAVHCFIADLTSIASRSYRLTFVNYMNSIASLCVTFLCGYVIKYYGYLYLFIASVALAIVAFIYTILMIPESLVELNEIGFCSRLKSCSVAKVFNCFKVYLPKSADRRPNPEEDEECNERTTLLNRPPTSSAMAGVKHPRRQAFIIMNIVLANFVYNLSGAGLGAIFTLFIMNEPYCFDSIDISNYTLFSTVVSLVMSLLVSKCFRVNDLLICILSVLSHFASIFCYIFGETNYYIYLGSIISSIAGLEYGYVRSIVSKSFSKQQVPDALSLIVTVDTFINVVSVIVFPIMYAKLVSTNVKIIFYIINAVNLVVLFLHL